jgi:hypothetical protein
MRKLDRESVTMSVCEYAEEIIAHRIMVSDGHIIAHQ